MLFRPLLKFCVAFAFERQSDSIELDNLLDYGKHVLLLAPQCAWRACSSLLKAELKRLTPLFDMSSGAQTRGKHGQENSRQNCLYTLPMKH